MPYEYNPLLKDGLQKVSNGGGDVDERIAALQNAVNALQESLNALKNSKITKIASTSQLSELSDGEIFEWQGASTSDYQNGYFYKKNGNNYTRVDLQPNYTLPIANANNLGGVKVGSGLNVDETGLLSVTGGDSLKVPRCFTQAQINALTDNDIFEWQGETTADYTQGYFYKKTSNTTVEVQAGDYYVKVSQSHERALGNYSIKQGYYTFVENKTTLWIGYCQSYNPSVSSYSYYTNYPAVVGQKVAKCSNHDLSALQLVDWVTVASIDENGKPATFSDGSVYNQYSASTGNVGNLAVFQAADGTKIGCGISLQGSLNVVGMIFAIDNDVWYPLNFYCSLIKTQAASDIVVTTNITAQKDTQPQPTIASTNKLGVIKVGANLAINANGVLSGNYQTATPSAAGLMSAADKSKLEAYIYTRISLSPTSGESMESGFKRFVTQLTTLYPNLASNTIFRLQLNFYNEILVDGGASGLPSEPIDGHFSYCNFIALRLVGSTQKIYVFGWQTSTWYYREI